jgi:hypothetical protein
MAVGRQLQELVGVMPFAVIDTNHPTLHPRVLRMLVGETAVSIRPDRVPQELLLETNQGQFALRFSRGQHDNVVFDFADGQLHVSDMRREEVTNVVMPLRKPQAYPGAAVVNGRVYALAPTSLDMIGAEIAQRLCDRTVHYAAPTKYGELERLDILEIVGVWIGQGYDSRLYIEVENTQEDHLYLPSGVSSTATLFEDGNVLLRVPSGGFAARHHVYLAAN